MSLGEVFPAVCEAEKAVSLNTNWWIGYQTLGRAQLGLGEVKLVSVRVMLVLCYHFLLILTRFKPPVLTSFEMYLLPNTLEQP